MSFDSKEFHVLHQHLHENSISLDQIRQMSYDDLEDLCNQLLRWKLFVANREFVDEAIGQFMDPLTNSRQ